jgi:hypothetical protein
MPRISALPLSRGTIGFIPSWAIRLLPLPTRCICTDLVEDAPARALFSVRDSSTAAYAGCHGGDRWLGKETDAVAGDRKI